MAKKNTIFKLTVITVILLLFLAPIIILYKLSGRKKKRKAKSRIPITNIKKRHTENLYG